MTFNEYQQAAVRTKFASPKLFMVNKANEMIPVPYAYSALGLGEAGEAQNKIKKVMRDSDGVIMPEIQTAVKGELGGLLWYIAATAADFGLEFDDVAASNIETLKSRMERGTLHGSGDNR